jgi:hypothetical protein
MDTKVNWFGLAGGISVITLILASLFVPWWQLIIGDSLITTNVSPLNTNFTLIGNSLTIPLLVALNIASLISMSAGGILMLIYSINPLKPYSKKLLGFSYRKPLYALILFIVGLVLTTIIIGSLFNFNIPLLGTRTSTLPSEMTQGVTLSVVMNAGFQWPFILAITATILCISARLYHKKIITKSQTKSIFQSPQIIYSNPISLLE